MTGPSAHAVLSPSSAHRWINCPASVRLSEKVHGPETVSIFALEGTKAHALGEMKASLEFGFITRDEFSAAYDEWIKTEPHLDEHDAEAMEDHTDAYVEFIRERMGLFPHSILMLEQRMPSGIPHCWGTSDVVIVSPEHVEIIDLKYGTGLQVYAAGNPQLRLYALGALDTYGDVLGDVRVVRMTVFQPRLHHVDTEELPVQELLDWRESVIPIAEEALGDNARFGPSEEACRWCPAAGVCTARTEVLAALDFEEDPDILTPEQMGDVLGRLKEIRDWADAVEQAALRRMYSDGEHIPGFKVVRSNGRRYVVDEDSAMDRLLEYGLPIEKIVTTKLNGIGVLERAIKSVNTGTDSPSTAKLEDVLGELVQVKEGKPSVVKESDRRKAIDPDNEARREFDDGGTD